jgi:hypothetical protein
MFLIGASIGCARSDPPRHQLISIQDSREVSAQSGCFAFNHCHAVVNWPGLMIGSYTSLYVAPMYDNHDINSFINNEMWLIDSTTQSCRSSPTLDCLVEAGYQASQGGVHYFVEEHFTDHRLFHAMGYIPTDGTGDFGWSSPGSSVDSSTALNPIAPPRRPPSLRAHSAFHRFRLKVV